MRIINGFRLPAALGSIFFAVTFDGSASAAASGKFAAFCEFHLGLAEVHRSSVFQADDDDRDDWALEWREHLLAIGVKKEELGRPFCRAWRGADAFESANAAAAKPQDFRPTVRVNWVPRASLRSSAATARPRPTEPRTPDEPLESTPAPSRYVEIAGPDGKTIRLSPEVAARNQAASDEYRRKMEEFARVKADHERKLAKHQQSQAEAAAQMRAYEQKLAVNEADVATHAAAMEQHAAATKPPAKGAKGWMYCDARGAPGDKRRYYSRIAEVDYVPGEKTIIDVMARNRPAFKSYVTGTHAIYFATDSLLHCPYSTTSLADAESLMARDKRGDRNSAIEVVQTGWLPAS